MTFSNLTDRSDKLGKCKMLAADFLKPYHSCRGALRHLRFEWKLKPEPTESDT